MGFFDNAFKNEDLGAAKPAGGAQKKTVEVKVLGKPMQALPGQRLKDVVRASRAPISCGPPRPDRVERSLPSAARAAGSIARTASAARAREKSTGARRAWASRRCRRAAARSRRCRAGVYKHIVGAGGCRVARAFGRSCPGAQPLVVHSARFCAGPETDRGPRRGAGYTLCWRRRRVDQRRLGGMLTESRSQPEATWTQLKPS